MAALMNNVKIVAKVFRVFSLSFCLLGFATSAFSESQLKNMYEAVVQLADRSEVARIAAVSAGLEQVLIKYAGRSDVIRAVDAAMLQDAQRFVVEYAVESVLVPSEDQLSTEKMEALWIRYNATSIDQFVSDQRLPIWPALRADVRYIVLRQRNGEPVVRTAQDEPAVFATLERFLLERGLPYAAFESPKMSASRIWRMNDVDALQLRNQSGADIVVVVRILDGPVDMIDPEKTPPIGAELIIVHDDERSFFGGDSAGLVGEATAGLPAGASLDVASAIHQFVDKYASNRTFVGLENGGEDIYISVLGMEMFSEYQSFLDVVTDLEQVSSARLEAVAGEQMLFRVSYGAEKQRLLQALARRTSLVVNTTDGSTEYKGSRDNPLVLTTSDYRGTPRVDPIFRRPIPALPQPSAPERVGQPLSDQPIQDRSF